MSDNNQMKAYNIRDEKERIDKLRKDKWMMADVILQEYKDEKKNKNKYGNRRLKIDGYSYDSAEEFYRHLELKILEEEGIISNLKFHASEDSLLLVENPNVRYYPDFSYTNSNGVKVVEDVKGMQTDVFKIKKKIVISKLNNGEYNFLFILTRRYKDGFKAFESYAKGYQYKKTKNRRRKNK